MYYSDLLNLATFCTEARFSFSLVNFKLCVQAHISCMLWLNMLHDLSVLIVLIVGGIKPHSPYK